MRTIIKKKLGENKHNLQKPNCKHNANQITNYNRNQQQKPNKQANSLDSGRQFQMGMLHFPCFQLKLKDLQQRKPRNQEPSLQEWKTYITKRIKRNYIWGLEEAPLLLLRRKGRGK